MNIASPLLTDLYQITMAQGYWACNKLDTQACFHMYFRDYPFNGGYAVACGMAQLAEIVDGFSITAEDAEYLKCLKAPQGGALLDENFVDYLTDLVLSIDIDAVEEGTIVFPYEPIVRVTGPMLQCQLLETILLNCVNFQTLIATKASRVCQAAGGPVAEFGLRRAQGACGGLWPSRASIVGGCASTSNVLAGKMFDIPVSGTHAHSWVMAFEDELTAFREYARIFPNNCILLVDTYDVKHGIENAITVGLEMKKEGNKLLGIRIDSGDLTWFAKMAREMLDEAGLTDCGIVLSNDLDEYSIHSIIGEGAVVSSWGVGTKLATAYDQPSLGGVYKLSATKLPNCNKWENHIKISESVSKTTFPGILNVRRYIDENDKLAGDMVYDINSSINDREIIVDPNDGLRFKSLSGRRYESLLIPLIQNGKSVVSQDKLHPLCGQARTKKGLEMLDETQKRILNPHTYPVGLEKGLSEYRNELVMRFRAAN